MKSLIAPLIALLFTVVACSDPTVCTLSFVYGIVVRVEDSASGAHAGSGALLVLRDGAYIESTEESFDGLHLHGAGERAGVYTVTVEKPTYHDWAQKNVRVTAGACHVHPVSLTARLQPN
jgi:hypothetical protein